MTSIDLMSAGLMSVELMLVGLKSDGMEKADLVYLCQKYAMFLHVLAFCSLENFSLRRVLEVQLMQEPLQICHLRPVKKKPEFG